MNGMTTGLLPEGTCTLSVVVPVYNEADGLLAYLGRLCVENKRHPLYLIEEHVPATQSAARLANELFRAGGR